MTDAIDRIRAQYTGTHRCDPPGSVADDMRTLIAEIERQRDEARRAAIAECIAEAERWNFEGPHDPNNRLARAWQEGAEAAQRVIVGDLRALIDEPAGAER